MGDYELKKILEGSFNVYKDAILDVAVRSIKEHEYKTSQKASCGDCVSREAVKDWLELWNGYLDEDMITRMKSNVDCIPGVQQNTDALDKIKTEILGTLYVDSLIFGELIDFKNGKISADDVIEEFNRVTRIEVLKIIDKHKTESEGI